MNRDYYAGMTEGRIQEREKMSIDEKKLFESGVNNERTRIINLLAADCNHAEPSCYHREVIALIRESEK